MKSIVPLGVAGGKSDYEKYYDGPGCSCNRCSGNVKCKQGASPTPHDPKEAAELKNRIEAAHNAGNLGPWEHQF